MIVAVAGASYPAARALARRLNAAGHTVLPLPRTLGRLPGVDVVVNFRVRGRATLLARIRDLPRPPAFFQGTGDVDALLRDTLGREIA